MDVGEDCASRVRARRDLFPPFLAEEESSSINLCS
jgi:hypothetical protein